MRGTPTELPPCTKCGAKRTKAGKAGTCDPCGCVHRHLHPGRYEGAHAVCLDCRSEVLILARSPEERAKFLEYEKDRYTRGRALAAKDLRTAPLWPATRLASGETVHDTLLREDDE
jgi:hypothetical protein